MPSVEPRLCPFWQSSSMEEECGFFMGSDDAESTVSLLFRPIDGLSVQSASRDTTYVEDRDYVVDRSAGSVTRIRGSRIPATRQDELAALACADDDAFHRRQISMSYAHGREPWVGHTPSFRGADLPRTLARLTTSTPIAVTVTGDSISEGYNASGFVGVPPFQPAYAALVARGLEQAYSSQIALHNLAVAGWTADDGLADVERVVATNPDLTIVAYGMNDASYAEPADLAANVQGIVEAVRASSPQAEFVLVSPMLPIAAADAPEMTRIPAYRDALGRLTGPGIVLADLTTMWRDLLRRKSDYDLSGNGFNHPNDFGHRVYAQVILALLVDEEAIAARSGATNANDARRT